MYDRKGSVGEERYSRLSIIRHPANSPSSIIRHPMSGPNENVLVLYPILRILLVLFFYQNFPIGRGEVICEESVARIAEP
jgi:hypothetical protein